MIEEFLKKANSLFENTVFNLLKTLRMLWKRYFVNNLSVKAISKTLN